MNKSAPKIDYVLVPRDVAVSCKACCENWLHARCADPLERRLLIRSIDILARALAPDPSADRASHPQPMTKDKT